MKQNVYIDKSGAGQVTFDIDLADYLSEVVEQISTLFADDDQKELTSDDFFNIPQIREDFRKRPGVKLQKLESPTKDRLQGEFSFDNINILLQDINTEAKSKLITFSQNGQRRELKVRVTRATVNALLKANPSLNTPLVASFGPSVSEDLTEDEYLEMMEFAIGSQSRRGIKESFLDLTVQVEGRIINQSGGEIVNANTVRYKIPMLSVLMLKKTMMYSLQY